MIGDDAAQEIQPKQGHLRQDAAFVGDAGGEDEVEGGDAVGSDNQQALGGVGTLRVLMRGNRPGAGFVDVANLAAD